MSRYGNHNSNVTQAAVAANMLTSIAAKEDNYKQTIMKNHGLTKSIAARLYKVTNDDIVTNNTIHRDSNNGSNSTSYTGPIESILLKAISGTSDMNNSHENKSKDDFDKENGSVSGSAKKANTKNSANNSSKINQNSTSMNSTTTTTQSSLTSSSASVATVDGEKIQQFLQEQRKRIQMIARTNVENERNAVIFCKAIRTLKQQMESKGGMGKKKKNDNDGNNIDHDENETMDNTYNNDNKKKKSNTNNEEDHFVDYQDLVEKIMEQERQTMQSSQITIEHEKMYREVCDAMGLPVESPSSRKRKSNGKKTSNKGKRRKNQSQVGNDDNEENDDDDLIVLGGVGTNSTGIASLSLLKCPITGTELMDDPVRNKICRHVYSRSGILQHITKLQNKSTTTNRSRMIPVPCPVPGCSNQNVKEDQLENDAEIEIQIRRERRRRELQMEMQANVSENDDDDDDDDDDEDDDDENENNINDNLQ